MLISGRGGSAASVLTCVRAAPNGILMEMGKSAFCVELCPPKRYDEGPAQWHSGQVRALRFGGPGFTGLNPRHGPSTAHQTTLWRRPTYKIEEDMHRY